jgi:hypothetical protein
VRTAQAVGVHFPKNTEETEQIGNADHAVPVAVWMVGELVCGGWQGGSETPTDVAFCPPRIAANEKKHDVTFASHGFECYVCVTLNTLPMNVELIIPILGILAGIIIPISVFVWMYFDEKGKREAVMEIARHLDDPAKIEDLLNLFDERKKEPIDYRRGGVITLFVGLGLFILGWFFLGNILKGVGALVGLIGVGVLIAGYLYPNTGKELTNAVDHFERK